MVDFQKEGLLKFISSKSSGKTKLALQEITQCQKSGGLCDYIDAENALNAKYCQRIEVAQNKLLFAQPESGNKVLQLLRPKQKLKWSIQLLLIQLLLLYQKHKSNENKEIKLLDYTLA